MGGLSSKVRQSIESRLKVLSRGAAGGGGLYSRFKAVPPLLSCDFVLDFHFKEGEGHWESTDYMLTDLNGIDGAGLSWSPDSHDGLIPMPDVKVQYFTVQFYVSGDLEASPNSFPTLYFYESQFTSDGLLRLPGKSRDMYRSAGDRFVGSKLEDIDADDWFSWVRIAPDDVLVNRGGSINSMDVYERPIVTLYAVFNKDGSRERLALCEFADCVFGTPHSSFAVGQTAAMSWTQQIGFGDITWGSGGRSSGGTFWERAGGVPVAPPMVKPFKG